MSDERCWNCRFVSKSTEYLGTCLLNPPTISDALINFQIKYRGISPANFLTDTVMASVSPGICHSDWCGKYEPKKEQN